MDWDWKKNPVRFDPRRGYSLCEPCWNGQHFSVAYRDRFHKHHPKTSNCLISKFKNSGECGCGCLDPGRKKVKFTGEGQEEMFK